LSLIEQRGPQLLAGADRPPTGRAACRSCRELIEKDIWRIRLVFFEEGQFNPSGFIHATCSSEYLGTSDVVDRIANFSPDLTEEELEEIRKNAER